MKLWTDGTTHVVLGTDGVAVTRAGDRALLTADAPADAGAVLAVAPGARAIFARVNGAVRALEGAAASPSTPPGAVALAVLDADRVLAALASAQTAALAVGPLAGPWTTLALPAPVAVAWPEDDRHGRVFRGELPWRDAAAGSLHWEITANAFGAAAVDQASGLLAVLPREGAPFALRVPADHPATRITAVATPHGVLVAHATIAGGGTGGLNHFAPHGAHLAGRRTTGRASAPSLASAAEVLIALEETEHGTARVQAWALELPGLDPREMLDTDLVARDAAPALHVADDGRAFLLGSGTTVLLGRRGAREAWETEPLR